MAQPYYTLDLAPGETCQSELEVKRSRFITQVRRVESETAARELISEARTQYFDARHHCSAFAIGPRAEVARSSDDGEPAGTAGAPMLNALLASETSDTVAVVSRYFGGIKLGAAGLTRAYGEAVNTAITSIGRRKVIPVTTFEVNISVALAGKVETWLRQLCFSSGQPVRLGAVKWRETVTISALVPSYNSEEFAELVAGFTQGEATVDIADQSWADA